VNLAAILTLQSSGHVGRDGSEGREMVGSEREILIDGRLIVGMGGSVGRSGSDGSDGRLIVGREREMLIDGRAMVGMGGRVGRSGRLGRLGSAMVGNDNEMLIDGRAGMGGMGNLHLLTTGSYFAALTFPDECTIGTAGATGGRVETGAPRLPTPM
jgi:hypothetical protein